MRFSSNEIKHKLYANYIVYNNEVIMILNGYILILRRKQKSINVERGQPRSKGATKVNSMPILNYSTSMVAE